MNPFCNATGHQTKVNNIIPEVGIGYSSNLTFRPARPAYTNLPGCTLSKSQVTQIITLVTIDTVAARMIEELDISRNADRVRERVVRQSQELLKTVAPSYGGKALDRLINVSSKMWSTQKNESIDPVTMLFMCLAMVEDTIFALRIAVEKRNRKIAKRKRRMPEIFHQWSRLAGSMFTLSKHLGNYWVLPDDPRQVKAEMLVKRAARTVEVGK